jgi:phosphatidylserine/phosphatidylglycerophosphate/cardiolipin synthase-like enzyme
MRRGERIKLAVLAEHLDRVDRDQMSRLADIVADNASPQFLADLIEEMYDQESRSEGDVEIAWTGPRLQGKVDYTPTIVVARRIVDSATQTLLIAGYRITASTLENLGVWSAIAKGVVVEAIVNSKDLLEVDFHIMLAKGVHLHRAAPSANDYSKFHIKALIADGHSALVGSANFTSLGQESNVELGVYLVGSTAAKIEEMLRRYVASAASTGWIIS